MGRVRQAYNKLDLMNYYSDLVFSAANTVLLLVLFFYQRNRNKVLEDQLLAQRQLLAETKTVVLQQASAIEGQSKVVDTALKYTSAFDPKKLEELLRREIGIEHKEEIGALREQLESKSTNQETQTNRILEMVDQLVSTATDAAAKVTEELISPLIPLALQALIPLSIADREDALATIKPDGIQQALRTALASIDRKILTNFGESK